MIPKHLNMYELYLVVWVDHILKVSKILLNHCGHDITR